MKSCLPRRPTAVLPPSRPQPLVFCQASAFHSWPRHPPLGRGSVLSPSLRLAFVGFRRWFHYNPRRTSLSDICIPLLLSPFCHFCFQRSSRKSFPIIGKPTRILSNHWKIRANFSNHWKNIFQSLENSPSPGELPDCANPRRLEHRHSSLPLLTSCCPAWTDWREKTCLIPQPPRAPRPRPGSFPSPRSGFHAFQCWFLPPSKPFESAPRHERPREDGMVRG